MSLNNSWIASNTGTVFINFHQHFVSSTQSNSFRGQMDWGSIYSGKALLFNHEEEDERSLQFGIYRTNPIWETFMYCKICILIFDQLTRREFAKDKPNLQCRQQQHQHQQQQHQQQHRQQQQQQQRQHQNLS
jgi:hypothetical protein